LAATLDKLRPQSCGILNDAVVNDCITAARVAMGMSVAVARLAMCCPPCVGNAERTLETLRFELFEFAHASFALGDLQAALAADGDAGGVVAAIFQPAQSLHQDRDDVALSDGSDDAAHLTVLTGVKGGASVPEPGGRPHPENGPVGRI
jgi:hypothetical protein